MQKKDDLSLDDWKTLNRLVQSDTHAVESMLKMNNGSEWLASELVRLDRIKHIIREKINTAGEAPQRSLKTRVFDKKKSRRPL